MSESDNFVSFDDSRDYEKVTLSFFLFVCSGFPTRHYQWFKLASGMKRCTLSVH